MSLTDGAGTKNRKTLRRNPGFPITKSKWALTVKKTVTRLYSLHSYLENFVSSTKQQQNKTRTDLIKQCLSHLANVFIKEAINSKSVFTQIENWQRQKTNAQWNSRTEWRKLADSSLKQWKSIPKSKHCPSSLIGRAPANWKNLQRSALPLSSTARDSSKSEKLFRKQIKSNN